MLPCKCAMFAGETALSSHGSTSVLSFPGLFQGLELPAYTLIVPVSFCPTGHGPSGFALCTIVMERESLLILAHSGLRYPMLPFECFMLPLGPRVMVEHEIEVRWSAPGVAVTGIIRSSHCGEVVSAAPRPLRVHLPRRAFEPSSFV